MLQQVAQVYQSINFSRLLDLATFTDAFTLERIIVDCVRYVIYYFFSKLLICKKIKT